MEFGRASPSRWARSIRPSHDRLALRFSSQRVPLEGLEKLFSILIGELLDFPFRSLLDPLDLLPDLRFLLVKIYPNFLFKGFIAP
jgi:hypothetical protein